MDLSVIIVSWNVKEKLRECLRSIQETTRRHPERSEGSRAMQESRDSSAIPQNDKPPMYEVFVVDNASKDGSAEIVKQEFPDFFVIANNFNAGFAKANNQATKLSQGRYVLLLNPDMRVFPGTLENMVKFMDEPRNAKVGVAGCHLVSATGQTVPHVRRFPGFLDQLAILLKLPHLFPKVVDSYMMTDFDYSKEARVDSIRGSFFMIRKEVLDKIGMLDEGFFIWFEEVDFCKRTITAGYEVAYTPTVEAIDYVGQSFKQMKFYPKQKMFSKSMVYYFKKHAPWWQYRLLWLMRPVTLGAVWFGDVVRSRLSK